MHCKEPTNAENLKQIFPEKELHVHSPNFHIHVSVSDSERVIKRYNCQVELIATVTLIISSFFKCPADVKHVDFR